MSGPARKTIIEGYCKSPELLEYKLFQVFKSLANPEQVAVHNDIMDDISLIVGDGLTDFVVKVADEIVLAGRAELLKEKKKK